MATGSRLRIVKKYREPLVFKRLGREFEAFLFSKIDKEKFPVEYELSRIIQEIVGERWNDDAVEKLKSNIGATALAKLAKIETSIEALYIIKKQHIKKRPISRYSKQGRNTDK